MTKNFINIDSMKDFLLEQLKNKFLNTEHYSTSNITVNLSLKELVDKVVKEQELEEPKIYMLDSAWLKLSKLVKECDGEVAWHCLVQQLPQSKYLIYDVLVFPQEVTGATANGIDGEYELWVANLPDETFENLRCHMHSHVNMGVTPSGTDENYYSNLMTQVTDYYITMIINKKGDYHLRFYDKQHNIVYTELAFEVCDEQGVTYADWYASVKDNIKTYKAPTTVTSNWEGSYLTSKKKRNENYEELNDPWEEYYYRKGVYY